MCTYVCDFGFIKTCCFSSAYFIISSIFSYTSNMVYTQDSDVEAFKPIDIIYCMINIFDQLEYVTPTKCSSELSIL